MKPDFRERGMIGERRKSKRLLKPMLNDFDLEDVGQGIQGFEVMRCGISSTDSAEGSEHSPLASAGANK